MTPRLSLEERNLISSLHRTFSHSNSCSPLHLDNFCSRSQSHLSCSSSINTPRRYSGKCSNSHSNSRILTEGKKENVRHTSSSNYDKREEVKSNSRRRVGEEDGERNSFPSNDTFSSSIVPSSRKRSYIDDLEDGENTSRSAEERNPSPKGAAFSLSKRGHYTSERESEELSSPDGPHRFSSRSIPLSMTERHANEVPIDPFLDDPILSHQGEGCLSDENASHDKRKGSEQDEKKKRPLPPPSSTTTAPKSISRSRSVSWVDLAEGKKLEVMVSSSGIPSSRRRPCASEYSSRKDHDRETAFASTTFSPSLHHSKANDFQIPMEEEVVRDMDALDALRDPPVTSSVLQWREPTEGEDEDAERMGKRRGEEIRGYSFLDSVRQGARKVPRLEETAAWSERSIHASEEVARSKGVKEAEDLWEKNFWSTNEAGNRWESPQKSARTPFHTYPFSSHPSLEREKGRVGERSPSMPHHSPSFSALQMPEHLLPSTASEAQSWDSTSRSASTHPMHSEAGRSTPKAYPPPPSLSSSLAIGWPMFKGLSAIPLHEDLFDDRIAAPIPRASVSTPAALRPTAGMHTSATARNALSSSEQRISSVPPCGGRRTRVPPFLVPSAPSSSSPLLPREEVSVQHAAFSPCWCLIGSVRAGMPSSLRLEMTSTTRVDAIGGMGTPPAHFSALRETSSFSFARHPFARDGDGENEARPSVVQACRSTGHLRWICVTPRWREVNGTREGGEKNGADWTPTEHPVTISIDKIQEVLLNPVVLEGHDDTTESAYATLGPSHVQVRAGGHSSSFRRIQERYSAVTIRMASGCRPQQVTFGFDACRKSEARRLRTLLLPLVSPSPR